MAEDELDMLDVECPICLDVYIDPAVLTCGHLYCKSCIESVKKITKVCPTCRSPISKIIERDDRVKKIKKIIATHYVICPLCGKTTLLSGLREHRTACEEAAENSNEKTSACNHSMSKIIRCALDKCSLAYPLFDEMIEWLLYPWSFSQVFLFFWTWEVYDWLASVMLSLWDYVVQ
ncbi:RING finger protein 166-like [Centruroides sculpturatus]|uniref:RING finger protein 166-like n=1 Tax=Centruroides sculpturatus TaxID=218467 RepID=UPI000C6EAA7F|nr:RING finger protein 166-like [Centruroides sculpturatus]